MKVISLISKHSGRGQTTIAVNLASGLIRKGYRVLIINPGQNEKLHNWLLQTGTGIVFIKNYKPAVIVKAKIGNKGKCVFLNLQNEDEVKLALEKS